MDIMVGAYGSSQQEEGAAHVVYGTNTSAAYEASFLDDLGAGGDGGLDGVDGFTLTGIMMDFPLYAELVRHSVLINRWTGANSLPDLSHKVTGISQARGGAWTSSARSIETGEELSVEDHNLACTSGRLDGWPRTALERAHKHGRQSYASIATSQPLTYMAREITLSEDVLPLPRSCPSYFALP